MTNNDIFRGLRYLLNVTDGQLAEITALGGGELTPTEVDAYLKREDEAGYRPCPDVPLSCFLNGLVVFKRGRDESRPPPPIETPITNNSVMKKIRVAFELKDTDVIKLIEKSGSLKISKSELSAFFRNRGHRNYRECGDQYLRNLMKALSL